MKVFTGIQLVSLITVFASFTANAQTDTVIFANGTKWNGAKIIKESFTEVIYIIEGQRQNYPFRRLKEIKHGDEPLDYQRALLEMKKNNYKNAINHFRKASRQTKVREWIHPYTQFYIAKCFLLSSQWQEAIQTFTKLLEEHPETIFLPQTYTNIGECYLALKSNEHIENAQKYFKMLQSFDDEEWQLRSRLGLTKIIEAKNDWIQAAKNYRELVDQLGQKDKHLKIRQLAYEGLGRSLLKEKQIQEAIRIFEELKQNSEKSKSLPGIAMAYNGLGDCLFKQGKYQDAALHFLRVNILYSEIQDQDAKAIFHAGRCFQQLSKQQGLSKNKKRMWISRSMKLYKDVANKYPASQWGRNAKSLIH